MVDRRPREAPVAAEIRHDPGGARRVGDEVPGWAQAVASAFVRLRVREVVYVPDNPLSHVVRALGGSPGIRLVVATREEEALAIAAVIYLGGVRAAVMMQSSGLGNSLNVFASLLLPYHIPTVMVVSMRGEVGEWNAARGRVG